MGLNDTYKVLRGQILMMKPLPNISTVYSMIVQEERQREITIPTNINHETIAMNVSHDSSSNFSKKSLVCTHCKKTGHSKSQCYRLIGFPSNFNFTKTKKDETKYVVQIATSDTSSAISQEQYNQLLQLLSQHNMSSSSQANSSILQEAMTHDGNDFSYAHL